MFNTALHRLLGAAYGPTYRLAGIGAWIFGGYGLLILAMAMAAGRTAESFAVYGKPLALAVALIALRRLARRHSGSTLSVTLPPITLSSWRLPLRTATLREPSGPPFGVSDGPPWTWRAGGPAKAAGQYLSSP